MLSTSCFSLYSTFSKSPKLYLSGCFRFYSSLIQTFCTHCTLLSPPYCLSQGLQSLNLLILAPISKALKRIELPVYFPSVLTTSLTFRQFCDDVHCVSIDHHHVHWRNALQNPPLHLLLLIRARMLKYFTVVRNPYHLEELLLRKCF